MNAATLWMVRSAQGVHYHTFYARGMVAIGWRHIAAAACGGAAWHDPAGEETAMCIVRPVVWQHGEIRRDVLSATAQKRLNAMLTVFALHPAVQAEFARVAGV